MLRAKGFFRIKWGVILVDLGENDFKKFAFFSLFDDIFAFFEKSCWDLTVTC
jgi:hypothetical protein